MYNTKRKIRVKMVATGVFFEWGFFFFFYYNYKALGEQKHNCIFKKATMNTDMTIIVDDDDAGPPSSQLCNPLFTA